VLYDLISSRDAAYTLSANTGVALMDEIKLHRRVELCGKGHRWSDMLRYDEDLDRTGTGADPGLYQSGFIQARASQNDNWLWQITQVETDTNTKMVQDPSAPLTK